MQEDGILPPVAEFPVHLPHEIADEGLDNEMVRVRVIHREPYITVCIQGCYQIQIMGDLLDGGTSRAIRRGPNPPRVVGLVDPRFIDVDNAHAFLQEADHLYAILLPQYQATNRVGLDRNTCQLPIPKVQFLPHISAYLV